MGNLRIGFRVVGDWGWAYVGYTFYPCTFLGTVPHSNTYAYSDLPDFYINDSPLISMAVGSR